MAPVSQTDHNLVEKQLKDVIQDLFQIMVQVNSYDLAGRPGKEVLENSLTQLDQTLLTLHRTTSSSSPPLNLPKIPPELIQYVDNGRNPDIYTREFVELARKGNQLMNGKMRAFALFRNTLAREICKAMPELRGDVKDVVEATGGGEAWEWEREEEGEPEGKMA